MRAARPAESGFVTRDGVRIAYDVYGAGDKTLVFFPAWSIVHSRMWKLQIPYFARHARVVTFDGRGNGRSEKLPSLDYSDKAFAADALAVMDATGTASATLVALSAGARWALMVAAEHPSRVERIVCIGPAVPLGSPSARAAALEQFEAKLATHDGWAKYNRDYWREHYRDFVEFFFRETFPEPHSTKQFEDAVRYAHDTTPETLAATVVAPGLSEAELRTLASRISCPVLVLHGSEDRIVPPKRGRDLAELTGGRFVQLEGSGHLPQLRVPVRINQEIFDAIAPHRAAKPRRKRKRALFISSPIGLGHAQRDAAIASELRRRRPDVEIEWLAQHPVTEVLRARGEKIHPASLNLVNETAHLENECAEHDLHAFNAIRRMDEILTANFMVFYELVRDERFDVVVGDEAWDVDHFLHENPSEKRTAFVWMTDFVGWLPMPDGGEYERRITADYNAEMIEHIARFPHLRDRSLFVGEPDDIVPESFGPGLPAIREWTETHYDFPGYVTGFEPPSAQERQALRMRFGYRPDEAVCIVTVGGSGVGAALLHRIVAAYPEAKRRVPELRMIVVAGPRIDPASIPASAGLEICAYVPELYLRLAACDVALVQGGLTTTMELTASGRPFIYFPLRHHFEQNFHVRHRLERYGAGRCMDYAEAEPERIAAAIVEQLGRVPEYRPVRSDGALKAAGLIAELF